MTIPKSPSFSLSGKRALITGASRGIGFAGACALAQAGAETVLVARNETEINQAAEKLQAKGYKAQALALDVTNHNETVATLEKLPAFDILFNNAGANTPMPFLQVTPENFDAIANVNFRAAFFFSQQVAKGMVAEKKAGSIIHTSSQMGHVGGIERSVYCGTKFAIEGITKASAIELAQYNIRVNSIAPTFIRTELTQSTFENADKIKWITEKIKLNRVGEVEDIMGALVFLASDAASLITGTSILVDGGWTAD